MVTGRSSGSTTGATPSLRRAMMTLLRLERITTRTRTREDDGDGRRARARGRGRAGWRRAAGRRAAAVVRARAARARPFAAGVLRHARRSADEQLELNGARKQAMLKAAGSSSVARWRVEQSPEFLALSQRRTDPTGGRLH